MVPGGPRSSAHRRSLGTMEAPEDDDLVCDLVLEGGGVKGIALAGAVQPLAEAGYRFSRIAGTSAGAIVGAVLAALVRRGEPVGRLTDIALSIDYERFRDRGFPGRLLGPLGFLAEPLSVALESGVYEGDRLHDWVAGVLKDLGVKTFGDLRVDDPGSDGHHHHQYALVVTATDLSRHRLLQLPWDYPVYGLDPDEQRVADAVRASASIPYVFEPATLSGPNGSGTLVDGGLVANYPIDIFDRADGGRRRWPTLGVGLDALSLSVEPPFEPVSGPISFGQALVVTAIKAAQAEHVLEPDNVARTIDIDTHEVGAVDFDLTAEQKRHLVRSGRRAAAAFLEQWDFSDWLSTYRGGADRAG